MPSKNLIRRELDTLAIVLSSYPAKTDAELEVMAQVWSEDLEGMSDQEFRDRVRVYRRQSRFFPTSADILAVDLHREHSGNQELPEKPRRLSEEERQRNKEKAGKVIQMLKQNNKVQAG